MAFRYVAIVVATAVTVSCSGANSANTHKPQEQGSTSVSQPNPAGVPMSTSRTDAMSADDQNPCDWVTDETVAQSIGGEATTTEPGHHDDRWSCSWQNSAAQLSVSFIRFECCGRSVEAELGWIGGDADEHLATVAGLRGAVRRPGVWFGETPLNQYGMAEIGLTLADGSHPDEQSFDETVEAVLRDATSANPDVPW